MLDEIESKVRAIIKGDIEEVVEVEAPIDEEVEAKVAAKAKK